MARILLLLLACCVGWGADGLGLAPKVQPLGVAPRLGLGPVPADAILSQPDVYALNASPTFTRATSAWDPVSSSVKGPGVRRTKPTTIGTVTYSSDLIEGSRTNLLAAGTSENLDRWAFTRASATANAITAPDGSTTADKLVEDGTASNSHFTQAGFTSVDTSVYSLSVYAKAGERTWLWLQFADGASSGRFFNLSTGAMGVANPATLGAGTLTGASITAIGDGWYRCTVTKAASGTSVNHRCGMSNADNVVNYNGDSASGLYLWGACGELGAFPSSYISNRNLLLQSETFDNASWTKARASITANAVANPIDGTTTADKLVEDATAANTHAVGQSFTWVSGATYTHSIYAKAAERSVVALQFVSTHFTTSRTAWFDLSNGTVSKTAGTAAPTITSIGNGWYRCSITATATGSGASLTFCYLDSSPTGTAVYDGDGASGLFIYGAQLEYGTAATTYWATTTAVGLRAADLLAVTQTISNTAGSLFLVTEPHGWSGGDQDGSTVYRVLADSDGTTDLRIARSGATTVSMFRADAGGDEGPSNVTNGFALNTRSTLGTVWDATSVRGFANGAASGTNDTSLTAPYDDVTGLWVGSGSAGATSFHGYVLALYKDGVAWSAPQVSLLHASTSPTR